MNKYLFSIHDIERAPARALLNESGKGGWGLVTVGIGHDPDNMGGYDFRPIVEDGITPICRINNGYGAEGTIPIPEDYFHFAERVGNFVKNSEGCCIWIIGNEPNHEQERPSGNLILPLDYSCCFEHCQEAILSLPGHENDQVLIAPVAPWNATTKYRGNESGDWLVYLRNVIWHLRSVGVEIDGFAMHAYTHGPDPALILDQAKMNPPFDHYYFNFQHYRDQMQVIQRLAPEAAVYITESNQGEAWLDTNNGWVDKAYWEINEWNKYHDQQIRCLTLYRWPNADRWGFEDKAEVQDSLRDAMEYEYTWKEKSMAGNLLLNPNFNEPYLEFENIGELKLADPWRPWWIQGTEPGKDHRPEYLKHEQISHSDPCSQKVFTTFSTHHAGIYQRVFNQPTGARATFSIWCYQESGNKDKPGDGKGYWRVGIDPNGGEDAQAESIVWSENLYGLDKWQEAAIQATVGTTGTVTVFTEAGWEFAAGWNVEYYDDATLTIEGGTPPSDDFEKEVAAIAGELEALRLRVLNLVNLAGGVDKVAAKKAMQDLAAIIGVTCV